MIGQVKISDREKQYGLLSNKGIYQVKPSVTGLLNDYTGAAAAYSLALLYDDYTGNCVTVRRASDNATLDIGFSNNELDTASLEAFCSGTDGYVTTWFDQSGNGANATQTTAANQPQIVSSGSVILENGKLAMYYDGTISKSLNVSSFGTTLTQPNTYFTVANKNDISGFLFDGISGQRNTQSGNNIFAGTSLADAYPISNENTQVLFTALFDGASSQGFINGSNTATGDTDTRGVEGLRIGNKFTQDDAFEGTLQSFVFYNSDQSANQRGIETALNDYYNIF